MKILTASVLEMSINDIAETRMNVPNCCMHVYEGSSTRLPHSLSLVDIYRRFDDCRFLQQSKGVFKKQHDESVWGPVITVRTANEMQQC